MLILETVADGSVLYCLAASVLSVSLAAKLLAFKRTNLIHFKLILLWKN
jgi:hypothetical protein